MEGAVTMKYPSWFLDKIRRALAPIQRAGIESPELHQPNLTAAILRSPPKVVRTRRPAMGGWQTDG